VFGDVSSYDSEFPDEIVSASIKGISRSAAEDSKLKKIEEFGGCDIGKDNYDGHKD